MFSADPVWNWLEDKGIISEMEKASGYHIARNETEDEFAFFAGGHADIVSMGSYEVPVLEKETGVKTVTFAKYNKGKDMLCVDPAKGYNSFADLPKPGKVGLEAATNSAHAWIALAASEGRTLSTDPGDLQIVITDFAVAPELVLKGQLDAGCTAYVNSLKYLMDKKVKVMYDGKGISQIFEAKLRARSRRLRQQQLRVHTEVLRRAPGGDRLLRERLGAGRPGVLGQHARDRQAVPQRLRLADRRRVQLGRSTTCRTGGTSGSRPSTWMRRGSRAKTACSRSWWTRGRSRPSQPRPFYVTIDPTTGKETYSYPAGA